MQRMLHQVLISCAFVCSCQAFAQDNGSAIKSASVVNSVADITVADALECGGQANFSYSRMKAVGLDGALLASLKRPVDFWDDILATKNEKEVAEALEAVKLRHEGLEREAKALGLSGAEKYAYLNTTRIRCGEAIEILKSGQND